MTDFGDRMMDFIFENEVQEDRLTGEQYLKAIAEFPGEEWEVRQFFSEWLFSAWCERNLPTPEIDDEEVAKSTEAALERFWTLLKLSRH